ncbi:MAG TPA: glycerophosphoryl diester phosphodiesterase membrane domain-containing protein [Gemmatimonadaceae bacterium]|nr:glycerophosphoryl diester phosphodiesterase membrane domain-containing protein [Gemmatimonadaceae bacterium]
MPATALRPRSATEIIDASFQLLRRHYTPLVAIAVVALLPYIVLVAVTGGATPESPSAFLLILAQWLCAALAEAAVIVGVSDAYIDGNVDIHRSLVSTAARLPTIILAGFLRGLAVVAGAILFFFPGVYVALRTFAIIPVVVLEERSAGESFRRSWDLAKGEVWKILGTMVLAWLIFIVLYALLVFVVGMIVGLLGSSNERMTSLLVAVLLALVYPITGVVTTLLYYDIRVRREGYDLELMAREAPSPVPSA